jgi:hypothetical protein
MWSRLHNRKETPFASSAEDLFAFSLCPSLFCVFYSPLLLLSQNTIRLLLVISLRIPWEREPVNLFTNADRDKSLFLVCDERAPRGIRPFHPREVANLHGFPKSYQFDGSERQIMGMIVDSVMPLMAYALARATRAYFEAIPRLAEVPQPLGHREIPSTRHRQLDDALHILHEPDPIGDVEQLALWA